MTLARVFVVALGVLLASTFAPASVPAAEGELSGAGIDSLAFIAGDWEGPLFGGTAQETWMPPNQGTMLGMMRLMWDGQRPNIYEFFLIEEIEDGRLVMTFRHFSPLSELWEREKEAPNVFVLVQVGERKATFDAPDRSQGPARFVFTLSEDEQTLTIGVSGIGEQGESVDAFEAVYARSEPGGDP